MAEVYEGGDAVPVPDEKGAVDDDEVATKGLLIES